MSFEKENIKTTILTLSGGIMMAHGTRMIFQGIFKPNSFYQPTLFDILFDWTTLTILGAIVFYYSITNFYKNLKQKKPQL